MNIYQDISQVPKESRTIVLGNFDGVHLGHSHLITLAYQLAKKAQQDLMVFTFYPQYQAIVDSNFSYLVAGEKKMERFAQYGVDTVLNQSFNENFARIDPDYFAEEILINQLGATNIVIGFNYTFGCGGKGNAQLLEDIGRRLGVNVVVMQPFYYEEQLISSSAIRHCISQGAIEQANALLGYTFSLKGEVIHGRKIGRTIGIPTANIQLSERLTVPANGVYAATVVIQEQRYLGVLNIGKRPTVQNGYDTSIEVHILNFDQDIYGMIIEVLLYHRLRGESKFNDLAQLKKQIERDMIRTTELLNNRLNIR